MTHPPTRPKRLTRSEIVGLGFLAIGPHIERLYDYIEYLEETRKVSTVMRPPLLTEKQIIGKVSLPLGFTLDSHLEAIDNYIDAMETELSEQRRRTQEFYYDGPLPVGYEIYMVVAATDEPVPHNMRPRTLTKARAQKLDKTWVGPWRKEQQGGLIVGDAWKHVTGAKSAEVDEAGGHRDG